MEVSRYLGPGKKKLQISPPLFLGIMSFEWESGEAYCLYDQLVAFPEASCSPRWDIGHIRGHIRGKTIVVTLIEQDRGTNLKSCPPVFHPIKCECNLFSSGNLVDGTDIFLLTYVTFPTMCY